MSNSLRNIEKVQVKTGFKFFIARFIAFSKVYPSIFRAPWRTTVSGDFHCCLRVKTEFSTFSTFPTGGFQETFRSRVKSGCFQLFRRLLALSRAAVFHSVYSCVFRIRCPERLQSASKLCNLVRCRFYPANIVD